MTEDSPLNHRRRFRRCIATLLLSLATLPALAIDWQFSGFATLGHAQSNRDFRWQRFIDDDGTWQRDTVVGGQIDASLSAQWSATVQAKLAPSIRHDSRWDPTLTWAFVAWRPHNDWLVRAGRLRVPLYLFSETQDVGTTFSTARLPNEMYWLTPTTDFTGLYVTRSWQQGLREISLDAYSGYANTTFRQWLRDGSPPVRPAGAKFSPVHVKASGLVLTVREPTLALRVGLHGTHTSWRNDDGIPTTFARVDLAPGLGYWQVDERLPGPGLARAQTIRNLIGTLGVDWQPSSGWRITAEAARARQFDTDFGADAVSGYLSVAHAFGRLTPYVTVGRLLSNKTQRDWVQRLQGSSLPAFIPGAAAVNASQQAAAQAVTRYDQHSAAIGASLALTAGSALKVEWMRSHIGSGSSMADAQPGTALPRDTNVNVRSIVFSTTF